MDAATVKEARALKREGLTYTEIAKRLGSTYSTVRRALDAHYARKQRERARERRENPKPPSDKPARNTESMLSRLKRESDFIKLAAEIPKDSRSVTGRLCGDPLPGRSALDSLPENSPLRTSARA